MNDAAKQMIWRYDFEVKDRHVVAMRAGAHIVHAAASDRMLDGIALWAASDPLATSVGRVILVRGTGHELGDAAAARYIGTVHAGELVWHVFDGGEWQPQ